MVQKYKKTDEKCGSTYPQKDRFATYRKVLSELFITNEMPMKSLYFYLLGGLLSWGALDTAQGANNVIPNSSLNQGISSWTVNNGGDCLSWSKDQGTNGTGCLQIINSTANPNSVWSTQIQSEFTTPLQPGQVTLTFKIKCANGTGAMRSSIATTAHYEADQSITTEYQTVTWTFTAKGGESGLCFDMGAVANTYYIDDVEVAYTKMDYGCTPPLHVDGKWLKDPDGNTVVLHGVMDTPNNYFNGGRWGWVRSDATIMACRNYFTQIYDAITDTAQGAWCNLFRLHLDPGWTNADGSSGVSENDISYFTESKLLKYLDTLYLPLAKDANAHGLYVILRPPGVCPQSIQVGDAYYNYLMTVWKDVVDKDFVRANEGWLSLELANEPITVLDASGNASTNALHDFFQPIADTIRAHGFNGILWIPGSGWQANYIGYGTYPITGDNIGYAVHDYPGWYGTSESSHDNTTAVNTFRKQVPVVDTKPIVITEVDWSPGKEGAGHYDEDGDYVAANWGTWATASTSEWGSAYKYMVDYFGNISMTLTGTAEYVDMDTFIATGKVKAAFDENPEGCGKACMDWYAVWAQENFAACDHSLSAALTAGSTGLVEGETLQLTATTTGDNPISSLVFMDGDELLGTDKESPYTLSTADLTTGTHTLWAIATDNGGYRDTTNTVKVTINVPQAPYSGTAAEIPGKIEAENYDLGGNGYAYYDTDEGNNGNTYRNDDVDLKANDSEGYRLGWTAKGEWLEYTVNVTESSEYIWTANVATNNSDASFQLYMDDAPITNEIAVKNTGDWNTLDTLCGRTQKLAIGEHVLKIVITGNYFDLDYFDFQTPSTAHVELNNADAEICLYEIYNLIGQQKGSVKGNIVSLPALMAAQNYAPGIYLAKIGSQTHKIVVP